MEIIPALLSHFARLTVSTRRFDNNAAYRFFYIFIGVVVKYNQGSISLNTVYKRNSHV